MMETGEVVVIPVADFERHMKQVAVCVGMLNGVMGALAQNPMFAGFLPPELRKRIQDLSE